MGLTTNRIYMTSRGKRWHGLKEGTEVANRRAMAQCGKNQENMPWGALDRGNSETEGGETMSKSTMRKLTGKSLLCVNTVMIQRTQPCSL